MLPWFCATKRSQKMPKCGSNISDTFGCASHARFSVPITFWRHPWSITGQMHGRMDSICWLDFKRRRNIISISDRHSAAKENKFLWCTGINLFFNWNLSIRIRFANFFRTTRCMMWKYITWGEMRFIWGFMSVTIFLMICNSCIIYIALKMALSLVSVTWLRFHEPFLNIQLLSSDLQQQIIFKCCKESLQILTYFDRAKAFLVQSFYNTPNFKVILSQAWKCRGWFHTEISWTDV